VSALTPPPGVRPPTRLTPREQQLNGEAVDAFAARVGGRQAFFDALSLGDGSSEMGRVLTYLEDERYTGWSLRKICAAVGLTVADLLLAYKKALMARAHVEAAVIVADSTPAVVTDVMTRATPQVVPCGGCNGTGRRSVEGAPMTCPACKGKGTTLTTPNLDRQKLALELAGLTTKGAGVVVNNMNTATAGATAAHMPGTLEQLQQAVGELLFSPTRRRAAAPAAPVAASPSTAPSEQDGA